MIVTAYQFVVLALCVACVSTTISQSILFQPFREFVDCRVFRCGYCLNHWVAMPLAFFPWLEYNIDLWWAIEDIQRHELIEGVVIFPVFWFALTGAAHLFGFAFTAYLRLLDRKED